MLGKLLLTVQDLDHLSEDGCLLHLSQLRLYHPIKELLSAFQGVAGDRLLDICRVLLQDQVYVVIQVLVLDRDDAVLVLRLAEKVSQGINNGLLLL